jgi:protein-disulfide isomerase
VRLTAHRLIAGLAALLAAGCSGTAPQLSTGTPTPADATSTAAYASPEDAAKQEPGEGFNPFNDPTAAPAGGREVIANPSVAEVMQTGELPEMAQGRADAPVTIIQYASMTCPHCRQFHKEVYPALKRDYIDTGKVRYILREFPIGKTSGNATIALRCAPATKYFELYGKYMEQQAAWVSQEVRLDPIFTVAEQVGLKRAEFDACLKNASLIAALKQIKDRGRTLGIIGTPNYFVNGKLVKTALSLADIRSVVETGQLAANAAR